mgnify:FL=1
MPVKGDCKLNFLNAYHNLPILRLGKVNRKEIESFARKSANGIKIEKDLSSFNHLLS